jgi:hypothetical protein
MQNFQVRTNFTKLLLIVKEKYGIYIIYPDRNTAVKGYDEVWVHILYYNK